MSRYNDELKLKLAWQAACEQRTCPPSEILYADVIDSNLKKHLTFCDSCRESRAIAKDDARGFQRLFSGLVPNAVESASDDLKQSGQIWKISKSLEKWLKDGRYFSTPSVLLLSEYGGGGAWKVAQIFSDKRLMSEGDIWLCDQFGFAQAWNTYTIDKNSLQCLLGCVKENQFAEVVKAAALQFAPMDENSIISFFRKMEITVGENVTVATRVSLKIESFLEGIFGSIADVYHKLSKFKLPEYADSLLDLLAYVRDPNAVTPLTAATSQPLLVNVIIKQHDGAITIKTVAATLTENNWEDGDYYVAGRLNEVQDEEMFLVASINVNGKIVCEHQSRMEKGSPYFDILFKSVPKEGCTIDNLRFILVKP